MRRTAQEALQATNSTTTGCPVPATTHRRSGADAGRKPAKGLAHLATPIAGAVLAAGALFGANACAPMAVVGAAIIVNDEFAQNAQTVIVPFDVDTVWAKAKSTLSHMTSDLLDVDNDLRAVKTYVDSAEVIVQVETYDVGQTRIRVAAKRYLIYSDDVATNVRDRIDRDLR